MNSKHLIDLHTKRISHKSPNSHEYQEAKNDTCGLASGELTDPRRAAGSAGGGGRLLNVKQLVLLYSAGSGGAP